LTKIRTCIDLLCEYGYVTPEKTLRETYEKVIGIYNLNRENLDMWKMVWNNEIVSLFQMEQQSGTQGIALTHPQSVEDLATLNSVIRLASTDKNKERPLEKYKRFRENPKDWDKEMNRYGLNEHQKEMLHNMFDTSYGISAQQEDLYQLMLCPEIGGYSFGMADKLRKAVAKKSPKDYKAFEEQFWKDVEENNRDKRLCNYIWKEMVEPQKGYSLTEKVKAVA
jgi:DNA polymerase-3 subunit alpha